MRKTITFELTLLLVFLMFLSVFTFSNHALVSSEAGEKDISVTLDKEYNNCTFTMTFKKSGTYTVTLIDPNGNNYACSTIDDTTVNCTLETASKGDWTVHIESENEKVGKVTVNVSAASNTSTDVVENIQVGKDITGLSVYLKDNYVEAEWTDETVENVTVTVTNATTNEIIDSQSVSEQYCEIEVPTDVSSILVTVVPTSSANIDGAEITYSFDMSLSFDASVTFPDSEYANTDDIAVTVVMNSSYGVYVEDNGTQVYTQENMDAGTYEFNVPLTEDGENEILFYLVDSNGNMKSYSYTVTKDTVAPEITFNEAYDGILIDTDTYTFSGSVDGYCTLTVDGTDVDIATDGSFSLDATLNEGDNEYTFIATDSAGNSSEETFTVTYEIPSVDYFGIGRNIIIVAIIIIGVITYIRKKHTKSHLEAEDEYETLEEDDDEEYMTYEDYEEEPEDDIFYEDEFDADDIAVEDEYLEHSDDKESSFEPSLDEEASYHDDFSDADDFDIPSDDDLNEDEPADDDYVSKYKAVTSISNSIFSSTPSSNQSEEETVDEIENNDENEFDVPADDDELIDDEEEFFAKWKNLNS